ncbi:biogenesis of lysosome- organelles complex 1 subunit 2 [Coemansia erecta]|nr:biogenesis of lysosome- organelles complex 1 subunit 2 [Coemansia erecta]
MSEEHLPQCDNANSNIETNTIEDFTEPIRTGPISAEIDRAEPVLPSGSGSTDSIDAASRKAFGSVALFLQSELEASGSEISLLEKLNDASITKYEELSCQAQDMLVHAYKIKQTYNEMEAQMAEVDNLVVSIDILEQISQELDRYSQQLEGKFQNLFK